MHSPIKICLRIYLFQKCSLFLCLSPLTFSLFIYSSQIYILKQQILHLLPHQREEESKKKYINHFRTSFVKGANSALHFDNEKHYHSTGGSSTAALSGTRLSLHARWTTGPKNISAVFLRYLITAGGKVKGRGEKIEVVTLQMMCWLSDERQARGEGEASMTGREHE